MKLYVSEKLFSLRKKYFVEDENNKNIYEITSKVFSLKHRTTVSKVDGEKVAYIEEKVFHIVPSYKVYIRDKFVCEIKRKFSLWKRKYSISNGYRVEGNFINLNFKIFNNKNKQVADINRNFFSLKNKYVIDIIDEKKLNLVLAIVVVILNDNFNEIIAASSVSLVR